MGEGSHYSDELKVACLAAYDLDGRIQTTARKMNVPRNTLKKWIQDREQGTLTIKDAEERIASTKKDLEKEMRKAMGLALNQIIVKVKDANAYQSTIIFGTLFDKLQIMEGNALSGAGNGNVTINNTYINQMADQEAEKLMAKALQRMQDKVIEADFKVVDDQNNDGDTSSEPKE